MTKSLRLSQFQAVRKLYDECVKMRKQAKLYETMIFKMMELRANSYIAKGLRSFDMSFSEACEGDKVTILNVKPKVKRGKK